MSTFSVRHFLLPWVESLIPTETGARITLVNPWVIWKRRGAAVLSTGLKIPFDETTKADALNVVAFSVGFSTVLSSSEHPRPGSFVVDTQRREIATPSGLVFHWEEFNPTIFAETFLFDVHFVDFDLSGKTVVEGGAFVGDTGLYYASKGACVYSFEPNGRLFELLKQNVSRNPQVPGSVVPCNFAIGTDGVVRFPARAGGKGSALQSSKKTVPVTSLSVGSILRRYDIHDPFLLHLDIKGLETAVLLQREVGLFQRVRVEYETVVDGKVVGSYDQLIDTLIHHGFRKIRTFKHDANRYDLRTHGTIDAAK
jgi:FkbM family methyltransferase